MYPLGHVGITLALATLLSERGVKWNFKLVVVASMLPDIVDKLLAIAGIGSGRFISHTLLFAIAMLVKKELFFGCLIHLVLDRMWETPEVLLFPLFGFEFEGRVCPFDFIRFFLESRYNQVGELIGAICLAVVRKRMRRQSLAERVERLN